MTMMATLQIPIEPADHILGNAGALVTLIEYGDYEYPARGFTPTFFINGLRYDGPADFSGVVSAVKTVLPATVG
jgi:protein-disulfide isomerase